MDSEQAPDVAEINGINLSNYYRDPYSYNPVVYIHKRHLNEVHDKSTQHNISKMQDKYQQYENYEQDTSYKVKIVDKGNEDPVAEQTIKFAKDIIPLTIPPNTNNEESVYYTIKTSKNAKRRYETSNQNPTRDVTFDKGKPKCANEKCKHFKKEITSATETSNTCSQNNTLDDVNDNRSLCCSLSEISERKHLKKEKCRMRDKRYDDQRVVASESLEAIATELANTSNDTAIKIHLMNDREKKALIENIRSPLIRAVKECAFETNGSTGIYEQLRAVESNIENNSRMLEKILDRLANLEKRLEFSNRDINETKNNNSNHKPSKLEELGEDLLEKKEYLSSEEELAYVNLSKKKGRNDHVAEIHVSYDEDSLGRGDKATKNSKPSNKPSTSQVGVKTDTQQRMPPRFCWTDAKIN